MDTDLDLFGENSIVGRSVVIHYDDAANGNPRWVCANIGSPRREVSATFSDEDENDRVAPHE